MMFVVIQSWRMRFEGLMQLIKSFSSMQKYIGSNVAINCSFRCMHERFLFQPKHRRTHVFQPSDRARKSKHTRNS